MSRYALAALAALLVSSAGSSNADDLVAEPYYVPAPTYSYSYYSTYYGPVASGPVAYDAPVVTAYSPVVTYRAGVTVYRAPVTVYRPAPVVTYYAPSPVYAAPVYAAPVYVTGRPVIVRPRLYVPGQPVRNVLRAIAP